MSYISQYCYSHIEEGKKRGNFGLYFKSSCFEISKIGLDRAFKYLLVAGEAEKNIFVLATFPKTSDVIVMGTFSCHFYARNYIDRLPRKKKKAE